MRTIYLLCVVALACGAGLFLGQVMAQEGDEGGPPPGMPAWTQMTEEHAGFQKLVGEWDAKSNAWMAAGQPAVENPGSAKFRLVFGGRFVEQDYAGMWMGQSFKGRGLMAYDTVDKQYVHIWMDSWSPLLSIARGTAEDGVVTLTAKDPDWMKADGLPRKDTRTTIEWQNDDQFTFTMYQAGPGGQEMKHMEIVYTRK